jgi:N-acetyltransferase
VECAFATVDTASGKAIGSSRYLSLSEPDLKVEIGWTWLTPAAWRGGANVEAKLLMLTHAFEELGYRRAEFKTDARNERSRGAIAALPAQFEGIFRKHKIIRGVGQRDSAYYSVIDDEWPAVKANLERRLGRA